MYSCFRRNFVTRNDSICLVSLIDCLSLLVNVVCVNLVLEFIIVLLNFFNFMFFGLFLIVKDICVCIVNIVRID